MTLAGKTALVTGASGFIGGALVMRLLADGARVRGLVRAEAKGAWIAARGAEIALGDVTDTESLRRAMGGCEVVFHLAAAGGPALVQYATNVTGTANVVEAAYQSGARRVAHVSSIAVYGYRTPDVITEEVPLRPGREHYGQSKALGERVFWAGTQAHGIEGVVIRPGMVYGPRSGFWTGTMFRLVRRRPALLPGGGSGFCPAIFIGDVVDLLLTVGGHPNAVGQAFHATPDPPPTWREFFGAYAAMAGHQTFIPIPGWALRSVAAVAEMGLRFGGQPQPVRDMINLFTRRRVYSMAKAAALLDWRPRVTLAEGMAQAEAWLRETDVLAQGRPVHAR